MVPIVLAMLASALRLYPFHGRLVLELLPAFFVLFGLGIERLRDGTSGLSRLGYTVLLVAIVGYPCFLGVSHALFLHLRDFNRYGDLHKNLFLESDPRLPIRLQQP